MGADIGLRGAGIQEGDTAKLHGNGAAVELDFGGEGRVVPSCYTSYKTRLCSASKGGCWLERVADITTRTSLSWSDGTFGRESG